MSSDTTLAASTKETKTPLTHPTFFPKRAAGYVATSHESSSFMVPYVHTELRSCVEVEVAVLGSPALINLILASVNVKQH